MKSCQRFEFISQRGSDLIVLSQQGPGSSDTNISSYSSFLSGAFVLLLLLLLLLLSAVAESSSAIIRLSVRTRSNQFFLTIFVQFRSPQLVQ